MSEFRNTLEQYRKSRGLGSRELSRMIGMTSTYVSQLERGCIKKPNYYTLIKLFNCLSIPNNIAETMMESIGVSPPVEYPDIELRDPDPNEIMPWLNEYEIECKRALQRINMSLNKFFDQDRTRAKSYIENLDILINSDKETFIVSCKLLNRNYAGLSKEKKEKIIHFFETVIDSEIENNKVHH